jgi:DNA-binding LacI/PurR family transcriptional regulator
MKEIITIKDIAKIAKVSITSVSLALNGKAGVSKKTRDKILRIAKKMSYRPNYAAKKLIGKPSNTIGLIIENITDPFYAEIALGVEEKSSKLGYGVLIYNTGGELYKEKKGIEDLQARGVDGVLISTVTIDDPNLSRLVEKHFPFVCLNRVSLDPSLKDRIDYIVLDNFLCGYKGVEHLYKLGHDRIALITGSIDKSTALKRTEGAMMAMRKFGIVKEPKFIVDCQFLRDKAYESTKVLLSQRNCPKAFFCQDDNMAIGVREAILGYGLKIPEEVALMGINDIKEASLCGIDLSTINQNIYEMGSTGADILIKKIENPEANMVNQVIMNSEIAIRKSCGYSSKGYIR